MRGPGHRPPLNPVPSQRRGGEFFYALMFFAQKIVRSLRERRHLAERDDYFVKTHALARLQLRNGLYGGNTATARGFFYAGQTSVERTAYPSCPVDLTEVRSCDWLAAPEAKWRTQTQQKLIAGVNEHF